MLRFELEGEALLLKKKYWATSQQVCEQVVFEVEKQKKKCHDGNKFSMKDKKLNLF